MPFNEPDAGGGKLNPIDVVNHLLMVWPVDYIEHSPTKHTKPGQQSDVIVVDVVDLDLTELDGTEGVLSQSCWWRPGFLIGALKKKLGDRDPFLARMWRDGEGAAAPYKLISATSDPTSVARAMAWLTRNPDFKPGGPRVTTLQEAAQQQIVSSLLPPPPMSIPTAQETVLERMARQAAEAKRGTPPQQEEAPF